MVLQIKSVECEKMENELENEIINELEDPDISFKKNPITVDIVVSFSYVGIGVVNRIRKVLNKYNYELMAVGVDNCRLFFTTMKKEVE